ncbi:two-component response regulator-like APRR2 isoform X2 [Tasmannia lanceolata]|uniref:two-component response regulator-like APRR2 isoform X2 n=1 Tax=Tasmannia lanceolata TaxID=3420 RepID=UPI0040637294
MVCSADDLLEWKDFPKGLRVLLLDEDRLSASEIKSKLEEMDYIVSMFCNENEALAAISNNEESFHVAIVEVSTGNNQGSFRFLETARDLPTIMISNMHCLSTMMKCIALGSAEFLQKPLSEDKLRNIWQHVVHKAFNAGESVLSKSLKPVKETVVSILQHQSETAETENQNPLETENSAQAQENGHKQSWGSDRYPAPPTPQLEPGRLLGDEDSQDQHNISVKKESTEHDGESTELRKSSCSEIQSVENTCNHSDGAVYLEENLPSNPAGDANEEEVDSADGSKTNECITTKEHMTSSHLQNGDNVECSVEDGNHKKATFLPNSRGTRANRKNTKVDWTPDLHRKFVQAVEQLGIDQAIPSRILEMMKVEGLTRHNIASHLQKYRMHRRHIMPKEEMRWQQQRDPMKRGYTHRPLLAFPPSHPNYGPTSRIYPVWGHPSCHPTGTQMWSHAGFPMWQPPENWLWKSYPGMHADAWGCPIVPPQVPCSMFPQAEEVIDKVVKEVMNQPWLPLPLGLKPPSTESVLTELHTQGITNIPPPHNSS